ncbi:MAG: hypothetical protein QNJ97_14080 [Myxococcota bacterium]|nr:hypothetical protein [Myxococcota bacterium]
MFCMNLKDVAKTNQMRWAESSRTLLLAGLAAVLLLHAPKAWAEDPNDILIIANQSASASQVSPDVLRDIFLKKRTAWPSGGKVTPVNASPGSDLRKAFREHILKMTADEERQYWQDLKIRKGAAEPPVFSQPLRAVFHLKGSVSYVFRSQYKEGVVKVLLVIPATN